MKIVTLITQMEYTPEQKKALEEIGEFVNYNVKKIKGDEIVEKIGDADILITGSSGVEEIDAEVLSRCPNLKFISVLGAAADFIDIGKATELGIKVSKLVGTNSESVAEHAWGMILNFSKRIMEAHNGTRAGKNQFKYYMGVELAGKTIGILGYGEIGKRVARIAKGFDMRILAYNRSKKEDERVELVELDEVLKESDVIVVTLPHTPETEGLIEDKELEMMKQGVILVNPARAKITDKEAVLRALGSGKLFGFGLELDMNTEPDERFYKFPNVIITPHNAFYTQESEEKSCAMGVENVLKFAEGNPQNLVN